MTDTLTTQRFAVLFSAIQPGVRAFKAYWRAFVFIQFCALAFVVAYYQSVRMREIISVITSFQAQGGVLFAAISNTISGALIPETVKLKFRAKIEKPITWGDFAFRCVLMATSGVIVYYFYQFQEILFGSGVDALTLLKKIIFDQLVFSPFVGLSFIVLCFTLHESKYRWSEFSKHLRPSTFKTRVVPLWAMALSFWPIMLAFIYALPGDLQFMLFLFANTAWCLVMVLVASNRWAQEAE